MQEEKRKRAVQKFYTVFIGKFRLKIFKESHVQIVSDFITFKFAINHLPAISNLFYCNFFGSELLQTDYDKNIRPYYLIKPVDISIDIFMNSFGSGTLTKIL